MFFKQFQYMTETVLIPKRAFRDRLNLKPPNGFKRSNVI